VNAVVLVHGFLDTDRKMRPMAAHLRRSGYRVITPRLAPSDGRAGLDELAAQLRDAIEAAFGVEEPIAVVGFSMGGLIARYYLQRMGGRARARRFLTLSSPHRGSLWAWCLPHPGIRQMRPGSPFLEDLNSDFHSLADLRPVSIWTPLDLMILPANSSVIAGAHPIRLIVPAHPLMVLAPAVHRLVERILGEPAG
jgi:triacylglycerol lipase